MLEGVKKRGRGTDGEDEVNDKSNVKAGIRVCSLRVKQAQKQEDQHDKHIAMWTI